MDEKICVFDDVYNEVSARAQAEREKAQAFGRLAQLKLWDRPKEADIALASTEKRYEPFWHLKATRRTRYAKQAIYALQVANPYAVSVDLLGQPHAPDARREIRIQARESCDRLVALSEYFEGLQREIPQKQLVDYASKCAFHEVQGSQEANFVPPTVTAPFLLQQVKARLMTPVDADEIADDTLDIESVTLYYRPVYAFQFAWKGKQGVIEIDGLSGRVDREGDMLGSAMRRLGNRDSLFDFGAELANLMVPGGGVIIKLVDRMSKG